MDEQTAQIIQALQIADLCSDIENCARIARTSFAALRLIANDGPLLEVGDPLNFARAQRAGNGIALPPGPEQMRQATMQKLHQQAIAGLQTLYKRAEHLKAITSGQAPPESPDGEPPPGILTE